MSEPSVSRSEITDEREWARAKVALGIRQYLTSEAYAELYKQKLDEPDLDYPRAFAKGLVEHIDAGVLVDLANAMLVPGLRDVNDQLEAAIGKVVMLSQDGATKKLERVSLVEVTSDAKPSGAQEWR